MSEKLEPCPHCPALFNTTWERDEHVHTHLNRPSRLLTEEMIEAGTTAVLALLNKPFTDADYAWIKSLTEDEHRKYTAGVLTHAALTAALQYRDNTDRAILKGGEDHD